jgi:hypothetical protein
LVHPQRNRGGGHLTIGRARTAGVAALAVLVAVTWSLGVSRYGGPDEPAHVLRAAAVADGQWRGEPAPTGLGLAPGYRIVQVPAALASGDPACYRHDSSLPPDCITVSTATDSIAVATSAGINPPWFYAVIGGLTRLLGDPADPAHYRIVAAVVAALLLLVTAWRARPLVAGRPWTAVAALAAVTPAAWFLVGVVNPNTWEVALAALGWVGVARFARGGERRPADTWWISVPMAAAVVARPVAIVAAVTMLVVVEVMPGRRPNRRDRWALWAPVAAAVAAGAVWQRWAAVAVDDPRTAQQGSWWQAVTTAIGGLPRTAAELVASLGWLEYGVAPAVAATWAAVLVATVVTVRRTSGPAGFGRAVAVWAVALVGTPVVFEVVMFWRLGPIWQGRYSLGVWLGLIALVLARPPRPAPSPRPARVPLAIVAASAVEVATFWTVLRRSTVGTDGSWWFTGHVAVGGPTHPLLLLGAHALMVAAAVGVGARWVHSMYPNTSSSTSVEPAKLNTATAPPAPSFR